MLELFAIPMFDAFIVSVFLSLIISGVFKVGEKILLKDIVLAHTPNEFFYKMVDCAFCMSHHIAAIFVAGVLFVEFDFWFLFVPLMTATITNKLQ